MHAEVRALWSRRIRVWCPFCEAGPGEPCRRRFGCKSGRDYSWDEWLTPPLGRFLAEPPLDGPVVHGPRRLLAAATPVRG
jgi:hypothetical protein